MASGEPRMDLERRTTRSQTQATSADETTNQKATPPPTSIESQSNSTSQGTETTGSSSRLGSSSMTHSWTHGTNESDLISNRRDLSKNSRKSNRETRDVSIDKSKREIDISKRRASRDRQIDVNRSVIPIEHRREIDIGSGGSEHTITNRPARSRTSKTSEIRKRQQEILAATLELQKSVIEAKEARESLAKTKLALIQLQNESSSDDESEIESVRERDRRVQTWFAGSVDIPQRTERGEKCEGGDNGTERPLPVAARDSSEVSSRKHSISNSKSDINALADALMSAISTAREPTRAPRYINELQPFDGHPGEWIAFKSSYFDTESYFKDIENVARIRKALKGAARDAVKSLLFTQSSPSSILEILERRFGRPSYLIKYELANLDKLPRMREDAKDVVIFAGAVSNVVATIKEMNHESYLCSHEIASRIVEKFNNFVKFRWYEYKADKGDKPILIVLSNFLNKVADQFDVGADELFSRRDNNRRPREFKPLTNHPHHRVNTLERRKKNRSVAYDSDSDDFEIRMSPHTVAAANTPAAAATKGVVRKCPLCSSTHVLKECKQFIDASVDERWELAKKYRVCFRCLGSTHRGLNCRAKICGKNKCVKTHHRLLHYERPVETVVEPPNQVISSVNTLCATRAYLKMIPVEIIGPLGKERVMALLDEGSTITLLETDVAERVGIKGPTENLTIEGVGGRLLHEKSQSLKFSIRGLYNRKLEAITSLTVKQLNISAQCVRESDIADCSHLKEISSDLLYSYEKPKLLIGQDNWHLIITREVKSGPPSQPVASLTALGWVLHGCKTNYIQRVQQINHMRDLDSQFKEFFNIESLGIEPRKPTSDPEARALKILESTTETLPDGRVQTGLLWKSDNQVLPESRKNAEIRLKGIEKKMRNNSDFRDNYTSQIDNLIKSNYAELCSGPPDSLRTWYLPHFAVTHPQKQKMRLVFDAAARSQGKCLNDALLSGPDLLKSLFGTLVKFRQGPLAVTADIKEMFLQVKIRPEDRDSLRFLWRPNENESIKEYRMSSLIFGATSSPCTAIFVKNKNAERYRDIEPYAYSAIVNNHYMDDYLQSFHDENMARLTLEAVDRIHRNANFHLRGWASNRKSLLCNIDSEKLASTPEQINLGGFDIQKTLGLKWDTSTDCLGYSLNLRNIPKETIVGTRVPTKREVASAVMSLFDPMGLISLYTLKGKLLLQSIWASKIDWNDKIKEPEQTEWKEWLLELNNIASLSIPRCISPTHTSGELHTFCDASEKAYAAAVYWKSGNDVHLIAAKSRVAGLKPITIPRLELQAALLGSRLATSIEKELELTVTRKIFWSDSTTVLQWINSDARTFKTFVAHRLAEIEDLTRPNEWRYIPSKHNVADDATREAPPTFTIEHRWFRGPDFLKDSEENWPTQRVKIESSTNEERKAPVNVTTIRKQSSSIPTPDPARFSSYIRLLRSSARVLQFIRRLKTKQEFTRTICSIKKKNADPDWRKAKKEVTLKFEKKSYSTTSPVLFESLTNEDLCNAENLLIKQAQEESFTAEIAALRKGDKIPKSSPIYKLSAILHGDNILRLSARTQSATYLPASYHQPILLDGRHKISQLIIGHYHKEFKHGNHLTVMNEIRQKYYITNLRNEIKKVARQCKHCIIVRRKPQEVPTGNLPAERLARGKAPFTCTGVDYFGPMTVTIGRRHEKRWGVLFTCLTTRAVHLELASSLSTDSMIMALRRMTSRRGTPTIMYSDNGTNFVGANRELKEQLQVNFDIVNEYTQNKGIQWKYIAPGAANEGGAWERLICTLKSSLKAILHERSPSEETLHTLIIEIEHVMNSRPLFEVNMNAAEESLTPNHFLIGRSNGNIHFELDDNTLIGKASWRAAQRLADHFWARWTKEYLPIIATRYNRGDRFKSPKVGDVALIVDGTLPRCTWPKGVITEVHRGADGNIRSVNIKTLTGVHRRPTSRLIVITGIDENGANAPGGSVNDAISLPGD